MGVLLLGSLEKRKKKKNRDPNSFYLDSQLSKRESYCVSIFFLSCIVSYCVHKIYKHLINFIKNYRYTYINGIFIINFEYIQLMTNLFITYAIIFNKLTK